MAFDLLPPEIRDQIYGECVKVRALGLLYTNKQIYKEFIPFLREKFVLTFHIDPSASSTVLELLNQDDSRWGDHCTIDVASPHADFGMIDRMPVDQFGAVRILVDPPDINDPGQVVRGWLQSVGVARALLPQWADPDEAPIFEVDVLIPPARSTKRLPPLIIQLREGKFWQWHAHGRWNHSIPHPSPWDFMTRPASLSHPAKSFSDMEVILTPFFRIRYAETVDVELPDGAPLEEAIDKVKLELGKSCIQRCSFGLNLHEEDDFIDDYALSFEDMVHIWLDYLLDDMKGTTASFLRRDRFKFWCSTYDFQMGRHFHGVSSNDPPEGIGGPEGYGSENIIALMKKTYHDRFMSAREHVVATYRNVIRRHGRSVILHSDKERAVDFYCREVEKLGFDRSSITDRFWETFYPNGIRPKSLNGNWEDRTRSRILYRLEPPERADPTPSWTFPAYVGRCNRSDQDSLQLRTIMKLQSNTRAELSRFTTPSSRILHPHEGAYLR